MPDKLMYILRAILASFLLIALTGCDLTHEDVNDKNSPNSESIVVFKPKPSVSITLYEGWQLNAEGRLIAPVDVGLDDKTASMDELTTQALETQLPQGTLVKHKTPVLLERTKSELLESEVELLRHIVIIFENPDDTNAVIDVLTNHPAVETVLVPPDIVPAEKRDQ